MKYIRKVELKGGGFNVFNFVIFPDLDVVDLPIFGVDIISLPGTVDKHTSISTVELY